MDIRVKRKSIGHVHGDKLVDLPKVSRIKINDKIKRPSSRIGAERNAKNNVKNHGTDNRNLAQPEQPKLTEPLLPKYTYIESEWICYSPRSINDVQQLKDEFQLRCKTLLSRNKLS